MQPIARCLFCGEDRTAPDHLSRCNGRQGAVEAAAIDQLPELVDPDPVGWGSLTNKERFDRFHAANPGVYRELARLARYLRGREIQRTAIALLFERLRWTYLETHGDPYKLNNTYRAFYARLLMELEPDLEGFFITRGSPHDSDYYERVAAVDADAANTAEGLINE